VNDVELMAVGPWFPEAARLLRENPGLDVGLHLTLTSEWDNVKWRPLTTAPSLVGRDGYFHPMIWPHPHYGKERALKEQAWKLDEIERELRAQVELAKREVPHLSHLSDHMGFQALGPEVVALVKRLAGEHGLDIDPEAQGVKWVGWDGKPETPSQKVESFVRVLEALGPGTWIFVDHPAFDTPEMRAVGHVGYENVAVDRQGVTDAWTSPAVKDVVRRRGIELIGYRDLVIPRDSRRPGPEGSGNVDMRLTRDPKLAVFERDLPALLALHTDRLAVRDLTVEWADDVPSFFTHGIEAESFRELVVDGFRGRQAQATGAAIRLAKGEDAVVRDSRAAAGTDAFVEATEVTGRTIFTGNDTRSARQPVVPASFGGRE